MNSSGSSIVACRFCRYYQPQGRRGGSCEKLDVHVAATWQACSLAVHPFEMSWQTGELKHFFQESFNDNLTVVSAKAIEIQDVKSRSRILSEAI
ncbi:MAG: hypothetical protein AUK48_07425 [Oscillatoriales cyanobacterium CG2_30_44_21]|nr:MAG: hypothetical protein AUK48_07425 [Oscillatoriales cyanobacterium CG2_30_44_21]